MELKTRYNIGDEVFYLRNFEIKKGFISSLYIRIQTDGTRKDYYYVAGDGVSLQDGAKDWDFMLFPSEKEARDYALSLINQPVVNESTEFYAKVRELQEDL